MHYTPKGTQPADSNGDRTLDELLQLTWYRQTERKEKVEKICRGLLKDAFGKLVMADHGDRTV